VVKRRAIETLHARGVEATIGDVRLRWGHAELVDLHATLEGVSGLSADLSRVDVGYSGAHSVDARGVRVDLGMGREELTIALDAWRIRHPTAASSGTSGESRTIALHEVTGRWHVADAELVTGGATDVTIAGGKVSLRGGSGTASTHGYAVKFADVGAELSRESKKLGGVSIGSLFIERSEAEAPLAPSAEVPLPPPSATPLAWQLVEKTRGMLDKALERFESGIEIKVDELTVGTKGTSMGPWGARAVLGSEAVSFELDPAEKAGRKPLVVRALVPRGRGKWTAELKMGPATLEELGVRDGAFGLTKVGTATIEARGALEIDPDEKTFVADGKLALKGASIAEPKLADGTVENVELSARGVVASKGDLTAWSLTGGALELGKLRLELEGGFDAPVGAEKKRVPKVWLSWNVPVVPCGDALASMPKGLLPKLEGMEMQGTFGAHGRFAFDAKQLEKTEVDLFLEQKCRVTKVPPAVSVDRFREAFELRVYDPKGNPKTARFGPGTPEWVPIEKVSPYVIDALLTCEDGAFFVHNGFSAAAIRNAMIANIKSGKFALGASTISMQLAKNVFLDRRKQLSRKLQEAVLTMWLEQAMSKNEMLELYLNVIEFGPNLYGIGPASMHYFGRRASDLDPLEATFLVSILPSPVKRHAMWEHGSPGDGYLQYLRTLLKEELNRGKLEEEEYQSAAAKPLVFYKPGDPPPAPHGITPAKIDKGDVDDPAFDPKYSPPAD
ncbi:MAG: transglycosylase domain-containing protein, partial [Polyangiales bacterium]